MNSPISRLESGFWSWINCYLVINGDLIISGRWTAGQVLSPCLAGCHRALLKLTLVVNWKKTLMQESTLTGTLSQAFENYRRHSNCKYYKIEIVILSYYKIEYLLLSAIDTLWGKSVQVWGWSIIYWAMCESQKASLAAYRDSHFLKLEGRKCWGSDPRLNKDGSRALKSWILHPAKFPSSKNRALIGKVPWNFELGQLSWCI